MSSPLASRNKLLNAYGQGTGDISSLKVQRELTKSLGKTRSNKYLLEPHYDSNLHERQTSQPLFESRDFQLHQTVLQNRPSYQRLRTPQTLLNRKERSLGTPNQRPDAVSLNVYASQSELHAFSILQDSTAKKQTGLNLTAPIDQGLYTVQSVNDLQRSQKINFVPATTRQESPNSRNRNIRFLDFEGRDSSPPQRLLPGEGEDQYSDNRQLHSGKTSPRLRALDGSNLRESSTLARENFLETQAKAKVLELLQRICLMGFEMDRLQGKVERQKFEISEKNTSLQTLRAKWDSHPETGSNRGLLARISDLESELRDSKITEIDLRKAI